MDLSEKKAAGAVLGLAIVLSTLIQSLVPVRSDAFTGSEGDALIKAIDVLRVELKEEGEARNKAVQQLVQVFHTLELRVARGFAELPPDDWKDRTTALERAAIRTEEILKQQGEMLREIQKTLNEERNKK